MNIQELENVYARLPQASALAKAMGKSDVKTVFLEGLLGSSAPMLFGSIASKCVNPLLFILQDAEEAGYFYHDLTQLLGDKNVLFFPSSYRRAVKYAQRDAASEILRTEVLTRLSTLHYPLISLLILRLLRNSWCRRKTSTSVPLCLRKTRV